ncbi:MAG TPA: hypothetical protein VMU05_09865, partial [Dongiaceae bacterium]|nr:hypothetical protein [Dongiaceae bacterium]
MERPNSTPNQTGSRESLSKEETPDAAVSLFLRLWSYGGPAQPPIGLVLQQDPEVGTIIHEIVREGSGQIAACEPELWTAHFADAAHALATAKALQQRFLTFHR